MAGERGFEPETMFRQIHLKNLLNKLESV